MKQKKIIIGIVIAVLVIAGVFALNNYAKFQRVNVANPDEVNLKEVSCDVEVRNPRGLPLVKNGDLVIDSANCQHHYVNSCGRFGLFSDSGTIRLSASGGLGSGADVKISEGASQPYTLNWCGSKLTRDFTINLFNENNENIQSKEVKLQ